MAGSDRVFIKKFDSFIYSIRKIIFFGNAAKHAAIPTKHERQRFINFFGWESNTNYYDEKNYILNFSDDSKLKDDFANLYTHKSVTTQEIGDYLQLFSALSSNSFEKSSVISYERSLKNFNRRLESGSELAESGSVLVEGSNTRTYKKNTELTKNFRDRDKKTFINALDFAIKKNNYISFASTYKRMICCRDGLENADCEIEIDHQLFNPILDEISVWKAVSAITEGKKLDVKYIDQRDGSIIDMNNLTPLKLIYDNLYGRTYLFACEDGGSSFLTLRCDRIFTAAITKNGFDADTAKRKKAELENILKTAWLVSTNETTEHVIIRFKNTVPLRERIKNEGRHGMITAFNGDFFTYEINVNDSFEMVNWVLNFGSDCVVVEPKTFRNQIIERFEDMAK